MAGGTVSGSTRAVHYHESPGNVTSADANHGRAHAIPRERDHIKRQTIEAGRLRHSQITV
jgi:hypothetical protein